MDRVVGLVQAPSIDAKRIEIDPIDLPELIPLFVITFRPLGLTH